MSNRKGKPLRRSDRTETPGLPELSAEFITREWSKLFPDFSGSASYDQKDQEFVDNDKKKAA